MRQYSYWKAILWHKQLTFIPHPAPDVLASAKNSLIAWLIVSYPLSCRKRRSFHNFLSENVKFHFTHRTNSMFTVVNDNFQLWMIHMHGYRMQCLQDTYLFISFNVCSAQIHLSSRILVVFTRKACLKDTHLHALVNN